MDWAAIFASPFVSIVGPAVLAIGFAVNLALVYRRGYIKGGPAGRVHRGEADFRWRIGLMWAYPVIWGIILADNLIKLFRHH